MSEKSPRLGEADTLALGDRLRLAELEGDNEAEGLREPDGELLAEDEGEDDELGDWLWEADGETELLGDRDDEALGLIEALILELGEREALGDLLVEAEGLREALGEPLALADGLNDALGDTDEEGLILGLAPETAPGAVPNQSTPGRGPGCPSSYKKILLASSRASLGRRDLSIRVITPRLKLDRVRYSGLGKFLLRLLCIFNGDID